MSCQQTESITADHTANFKKGVTKMYKAGLKVRVKILKVGMRTGVIVREALNAYWVEYQGNEYLVPTIFLDRWNRKGVRK